MKTKKKSIHIAWISDLHCGALSGLTPPRYQSDDSPQYAKPMYNWFLSEAKKCGPLDLLIINGDAIDGEGKKGTIDLLTSDISKQVDISLECISQFNAKKIMMTYGTPFHTVGPLSYENMIAKELKCEIYDTLFLELNGKKFSVRHVVGTSGTPYGQPTMLGKALINDLIQALAENSESADWVIRSHAHVYCEVGIDGRRARITPCLQAPDGILGRRLTTWWYHIGFLEMTIDPDGRVHETQHMLPIEIVRKRNWITL
ncbi:MAG: hypothetical protein M0P71_18255 [Melioribacteraceae bacterium]|nr:hypothetical protein [Melioribacteraceae bacterium]